MGVFTRFISIFQSQANELARQLEDPRASLDYSLVKLDENRRALIRSLVEVSAARRRLEAHRDQAAAGIQKYEEQAVASLKAGREDLARRALERKQEVQARQAELESHLERLQQQEVELRESKTYLDEKIASLRAKNEELKSIYTASRAQLRVREAFSGISLELSDVGNTIQRAEARIQEMQSRSGAIDHLLAEGLLQDVLGVNEDDIDRELTGLKRSEAVEEELAQLKAGKAD